MIAVDLCEEWHTVPDLPEYEASSLGRVREVVSRAIIEPTLLRCGYPTLNIKMAGGNLIVPVHQIVCRAWYGLPGVYKTKRGKTRVQQVRHGDDDRLNFRPDNLSWGTAAQNHADSYRTGKRRLKFSPDDVQQIRSSSECHSALASRYSTRPDVISKIRNGYFINYA